MAFNTEYDEFLSKCSLPGAKRAVDALVDAGVTQLVDVGFMGAREIDDVANGDESVKEALEWLVKDASALKDGWARLSGIKAALSSRLQLPDAGHPQPVRRPLRSEGVLRKSMIAFTRRTLLGRVPLSTAMHAKVKRKSMSVQTNGADAMSRALDKVHAIFVKYASSSKRLMSVLSGHKDMHAMQLEAYRRGSRSHVVVSQRARLAESFFLDISSYRWEVHILTPFQVATWIRGRMAGGLKTAASSCAQTLTLVHAATDWRMHTRHALVVGQLKSKSRAGVIKEPPVPALTPSVELMTRLERMIDAAPTIQLRCLCGFFVLLGLGSGRASDTIASKDIKLTKDSITGKSVLKNKELIWTQWFCARRGLVSDWAEAWLEQLHEAGLPGDDFILKAFNGACDQWIERPAVYSDLRRGLHFVLHACLGWPIQDAVLYNPHAFRHFLVESGQQLRSLGLCSEEDLERLGHWSKGSSMPATYDNAAGVSELKARYKVIEAFQTGWRPARQGELPSALPTASASSTSTRGVQHTEFVMVGNKTTKRKHYQETTDTVTLCGLWQCGSPLLRPEAHAIYDGLPGDFKMCATCDRKCIGDTPAVSLGAR